MGFDTQGRAEILRIPGVVDLVTAWDNELASDLRAFSMLHVLEHMANPTSCSRMLTKVLLPADYSSCRCRMFG